MTSMAWALGRDPVSGLCVSFINEVDTMYSQCLRLADSVCRESLKITQ